MISGERAEEKVSPSLTSLLDPSGDRESDGGDELSHYSSCGAESEFERYCSASSAMGTPTFRSSTSFQDSEFGSFKSFKLGGENTNFKNFGVNKMLSGDIATDEKDTGMLNLNRRMVGFDVGDVDLMGNFDLDDYWGTECVNGNGNIDSSNENGRPFEKGDDEGEDRKLSDEGEETLSRNEHLEGDESMFGCGSDDEMRSGSYYGKNVRFHDEEREKNENHLVMNSAVAFGSDDWDDFIQASGENNMAPLHHDEIHQVERQHVAAVNPNTYPDVNFEVPRNEVTSNTETHNQVQAVGKLPEINVNTLSINSTNHVRLDAQVGVKGMLVSSNPVSDIDELEYLGCSSGPNIFEMSRETLAKEAPINEKLKFIEAKSEVKPEDTSTSEIISTSHIIVSKNLALVKPNIQSDPLSESMVNHNHPVPMKDKEDREVKLFKDNSSFPMSTSANTNTRTAAQSYAFSFDQIEDHFVPLKTRDLELNEVYDEIVNDMEDILLDSGESPRSGFTHNTRMHNSQLRRPSRDGGSSASTSGTDNLNQQPIRIDRVEVVGAKQKMGDVSLSERLVGVKKYTAYKIRVWSGENHWEVERRYRDFSTLYHRLKKLFADHDWTLPSPWSFVEKESRKLFGNASPDVIADRSVLIQECLQSLIHSKFSSNYLNALVCFLSPSEVFPDSPASNTSRPQTPFHNIGGQMQAFPTMGKTISLVVQIRPFKSTKQMLDEQHYRCAGCRRNFDDGITRVQELVQTLGWGKPRLCEYSSQLFCSACHNNETAILPARVLHNWDFTRYPVSHLAKSYLDSIYDKPMLCVSAVNPFLLSKVPALQHVANIRNRIKTMLPYVRCPFRGSIYKGLGSRGYLLDSNDFFALRDLIDLSKGVFSALPVMVEAVSRKIREHITEQCLVCYDVGIPCGARKACNDPLSLIFPFQDGEEVEKCRSCKIVFHKKCFKNIATCSCGTHFTQKQSTDERSIKMDSDMNLLAKTAEPSTGSGLLAGLFSMVIPQRSRILRKQEPKDVDTVILMGSLPNTSL